MKKLAAFFILIFCLSCSQEEEEPRVLSSENQITSFALNFAGENIAGEIDQHERTIVFQTDGKDVSSLTPSVNISPKARIEPASGVAQDFTSTVPYTVYAEDGTPNVYRVTINNRPISANNEINSFSFVVDGETIEADIDRTNGIIKADVTFTDIKELSPVISIPGYASIDPPAETVVDFTTPVTYTVTAENGDSRKYVVKVNEPEIQSVIHQYFPGNQSFFVGAKAGIMGRFLMNEGEDPDVYLFDGTSKYTLNELEYHFSYSDTHTGIDYYAVSFVIPDDTPTNIYKVVLEKQGYRVEFDNFDVNLEDAPNPTSLSQEVFSREDVLSIYGENLTAGIIIPSDGQHYLIFNYTTEYTKVDIRVNEEKTEMNFTPDYNYDRLYPAYFAREPEEKIITFFDPVSKRIGRSIKTVFK